MNREVEYSQHRQVKRTCLLLFKHEITGATYMMMRLMMMDETIKHSLVTVPYEYTSRVGQTKKTFIERRLTLLRHHRRSQKQYDTLASTRTTTTNTERLLSRLVSASPFDGQKKGSID